MIPVLFFVAALIGAAYTLLALFGPRKPAFFSFPMFMGGWLAGDLAYFHIGWQVVATVVFVLLGALDEPIGVAALVITLLSWVGLVIAHRRHSLAEKVLEDALVRCWATTTTTRSTPLSAPRCVARCRHASCSDRSART